MCSHVPFELDVSKIPSLCVAVQEDILDMGRNALTLEDAFGKCHSNIPDVFTDQHPQNICTDKGNGENVAEHSSVPEG